MLAMNLFGKKPVWLLAVVVVLLVVVGVMWMRSDNAAKGYSVVYLTSGEIYVGHLRTFPMLTLEGTYLLQNVKSAADQTKTDLQLFPLAEAVWAPTKLYLNRYNVIYYGPLDGNSAAAKAISEKLR